MTVLNRFPVVIACYNRAKRRWFERAPMIQPWWFPADSLDRETFAANMLFGDAGEENFPRKIPAEAWFGFKGCERFDVEEQSFRLPGDEILTVLRLPDERSLEGHEPVIDGRLWRSPGVIRHAIRPHRDRRLFRPKLTKLLNRTGIIPSEVNVGSRWG